jgi:hypothetical protein
MDVVTLIHGTKLPWQPMSTVPSWTLPNSALRRAIEARLAPQQVAFEVFPWSGANSVGRRGDAAADLIVFLAGLDGKYPGARHHLVAHSHGGNVAMYALRANRVQQMVHSAVFLSTPFLHAMARSFGPRFGRQLEFSIATAFGVAAVAGLVILLQMSGAAIPVKHALLTAWGHLRPHLSGDVIPRLRLFLALMAASVVGIGGIYIPAVRGLHRRISRLPETMAFPESSAVPSLIVRVPGDEASVALLVAQVSSVLLTRAVKVILHLPLETPDVERADRAATAVEWHWLGVLAIGHLVLTALLVPVLALMTIPLAAFAGFDMAIASIGLQLSAEATPPGSWTLVQLPPAGTSLEDEPFFKHYSYEDPRVLELVSSWLHKQRHRASGAAEQTGDGMV